MSLSIPIAPLFADPALWKQAANNLVNRAEGLLRDELAWRRAHACLMAEYFRLGLLENRRVLNPWRRARYSHWKRRCLAEHATGAALCPGTAQDPTE